jgi:hypothetical protein
MTTNPPNLIVGLLVIGLFLAIVNYLADRVIDRITKAQEWKKQRQRQ